jgi:hypothetical protein
MDSMEFDTRLAAAADTLEKIAGAEGIDLNKLSEAELEQSLATLMNIELPNDATDAADKTASDATAAAQQTTATEQPQPKVAQDETPSLTNVDVSMALNKYAAANNVDLTKLSSDEYAAAWNEMAEYLSSPQAEQDKVAAAEQQTKLAEADLTGRQFARSFWDELQKLSAEEEKDEKDDDKDDADDKKAFSFAKKDEEEKKASFTEKVRSAGKTVADAAERTGAEVRTRAARVGRDASSANRRAMEISGERGKNIATGAGVAAAGTAAAGAAGVGGAAALRGGKKDEKTSAAELDALVTDRAREILVQNGVNPDSGQKFASDQELVDFLAMEKIRAAGIEV